MFKFVCIGISLFSLVLIVIKHHQVNSNFRRLHLLRQEGIYKIWILFEELKSEMSLLKELVGVNNMEIMSEETTSLSEKNEK